MPEQDEIKLPKGFKLDIKDDTDIQLPKGFVLDKPVKKKGGGNLLSPTESQSPFQSGEELASGAAFKNINQLQAPTSEPVSFPIQSQKIAVDNTRYQQYGLKADKNEQPVDVEKLIQNRVNTSTEEDGSVRERIKNGELIVEDGKLKEKGDWLDNLGAGIANTLDDIKLAMNIEVAKMNKNDNELKYYLNDFNERKGKELEKIYEAKGDFFKALPRGIGEFVPYLVAGATLPMLDVPLMGFSHSANVSKVIWDDKKLTEEEKVNAIKNVSTDEIMIGSAQMAVFHSLGVTDKAQAKQLLSQYTPTKKLFNSSKNILKALPLDIAKVGAIGAGGQALSNIAVSNEGVDVDWSNLEESAKGFVQLHLLFQAPKIFMAGLKVMNDARKSGVDKQNPDWFNKYNQNVQTQLYSIVSSPENVYNKLVGQLKEYEGEPIAQQSLQKIQTFRDYYNQLPPDLKQQSKEKALSILQLKTDAIGNAQNATETGIRAAYEQRAKTYDGLLQKLFDGEKVEDKEVIGLPGSTETPPPKEENIPVETTTIAPKEVVPETIKGESEQITKPIELSTEIPKTEELLKPTVTIPIKIEGNEMDVELLGDYKGKKIVRIDGNVHVYNPKEETVFNVALDDSNGKGRRINEEFNNIESAKKYIDWATETHAGNIKPLEIKQIPSTPISKEEGKVEDVKEQMYPLEDSDKWQSFGDEKNKGEFEGGKSEKEHATYIKDKFRKQFKDKGIDDEQIDGAVALMDARAKSWASEEKGRNADDWYSRIADVKKGEFESESNQILYQVIDEINIFDSNDIGKAKDFIDKAFAATENKEEINKVFRKLSVKYHPDRNNSESATAIMQHLNNVNEKYKSGKSSNTTESSSSWYSSDFMKDYEKKAQKEKEDREKKNKTDYDYYTNEKNAPKKSFFDKLFGDDTKEGKKFSAYKSFKDRNEKAKKQYASRIKKADKRYNDIISDLGSSASMLMSANMEKNKEYLNAKMDYDKEAMSANFDFQKASMQFQDAKGALETLKDGRVVIHSLDSPDFSTMVHEIGHIFEKDLTEAEQKIVKDFGGSEPFARGFEKYLRDGKAPTAELKTLFDKFKQWLTDIYKTLKGSPIEKRITPEIKQIFDRLLTEQSLSPKPIEEGFDKSPLKTTENYFLRYTNDPNTDLNRGTSVHGTDFKNIKEANKAYPDKKFIKMKDGNIYEVLDGLSSYMLEADNIEDAIYEAKDLIEYNIKKSGASGNNIITEDRKPFLFKGKYIENDLPDGDSMFPKSIVSNFETNEKTTAEVPKQAEGENPITEKVSEVIGKPKEEQIIEGEFEGGKLEKEPPVEPPIDKERGNVEGEKLNDKAVLNRLLTSKGIPEEFKNGLKDKGLTYETKSREESASIGKSLVNEFGIDKSVLLAEAGKFDGGVNSAVFAEALNNLFEQERNAKTDAERFEAATKFADISEKYDEFARKSGRDISQIGHFYKSSPLGVAIKLNKQRSEQFKEWLKTANKEEGFKEVFDELLKGEEGQLLLKEEVEKLRKEERVVERKNRDKAITDFFDKAKLKGGTYAILIPPPIWNAAMDIMAASVKAGDRVVVTVQKAIEYIDKNLKEDWDKEAFRKEYEGQVGQVADGGKKEPSYADILEKRKKELERRILEKDFSSEEYKEKKNLTDKEKEAKSQYDKVKESYDEARKTSKEYLDKKSKQYLEQFRKRLKGIDEDKKEEVIRRSIKQLIENGALKYDDFKEIIGDVMGFKQLTNEEVKRVEELVESINSIDKYNDEMVENPTIETIKKFEEERNKSLVSSLELYHLTHRESDITSTSRSIITGSLLSAFTLIKNPIQNVVFQAQLRYPKSLVKRLMDVGIYGISKIANMISPNSPIYKGNTDLLLGQKGYAIQGKLGMKRAIRNFMTGTQESDYFSKNAYQSNLSPRQAIKDLKLYKSGQKFLTKIEVLDRYIRKSIPARQADFILRAMGLGDAPQRYAAEGATAIQIAVKELGLKNDNEIKAFMLSPQKMAYKVFKGEGKSNKEAGELANEIEQRIISEGEKAVFQESNTISRLSELVEKSIKIKTEDNPLIKGEKVLASLVKTVTFPFVKIPANVAWVTFKALNPTFSMIQSMTQIGIAYKYQREGNSAKSREFANKSKDSFAHAVVGYGLSLAAGSLVTAGYVRPSNERDTKAKETAGEKTFGRQNQFNLGRAMGGTDYWVDLSWFGPLGGMLDVKAQMAQDKLERQQIGEEQTELDNILDEMTYSAKASLNQLVFDQGAKTVDAIMKGGNAAKIWAENTLNTFGNVFTGATLTAISKVTLDNQARLKGDSFWEEMNNNQKQRNILYRTALNIYKKGSGEPPERISIWGDKMKNDNSFSGVVSNLLGFEKGSVDKFGSVIFDDAQRTGNINFYPPVIPKTITVDGKEIVLPVKEKDDLNMFVGKIRKDLVSPYINNHVVLPGYRKPYVKLSDNEKLAALDAIYTQAKDIGMEQFKKKYPKYKEAELDMSRLKKQEKLLDQKTEFEDRLRDKLRITKE